MGKRELLHRKKAVTHDLGKHEQKKTMEGAPAPLITLLNARDVEFTRRERVTPPPLRSLPTSLRRAARCLVATQLLSRSVHHAESELTWARSHLELVSVAVLGLEGGDDDGDDGGALAALASRDPPAPVVAGAPPIRLEAHDAWVSQPFTPPAPSPRGALRDARPLGPFGRS